MAVSSVLTVMCRFAKFYHPHLPIAPRKSLQAPHLKQLDMKPYLLAAMITVAAKDLPGSTAILQICSKYMNELASDISGGKRCDVEAIETLLLLVEWEPQSALYNTKAIRCGEDLSAGMHVSLAHRFGLIGRLLRTMTMRRPFTSLEED